MQAPLLQQTLTNIHGVAVQIPIPTPQVRYWLRGLRLTSLVPQKIKSWLPCQTAIAITAKLSVFSCFVKLFSLVLLTLFKCFISSTSVYISMKDSNFEFLG